jgi:hypothetical protein
VLLAAGLATGGAKAQEGAVKELIPTGKLRFGVAFAPKMSALFVVKDAGGSPRGPKQSNCPQIARSLGLCAERILKNSVLSVCVCSWVGNLLGPRPLRA